MSSNLLLVRKEQTFIGRRWWTGRELLRDKGTWDDIDTLADFENIRILIASFKELTTKYGIFSAVEREIDLLALVVSVRGNGLTLYVKHK